MVGLVVIFPFLVAVLPFPPAVLLQNLPKNDFKQQ
jgi:hypothetical protein